MRPSGHTASWRIARVTVLLPSRGRLPRLLALVRALWRRRSLFFRLRALRRLRLALFCSRDAQFPMLDWPLE